MKGKEDPATAPNSSQRKSRKRWEDMETLSFTRKENQGTIITEHWKLKFHCNQAWRLMNIIQNLGDKRSGGS
jgi:hypothetical protein